VRRCVGADADEGCGECTAAGETGVVLVMYGMSVGDVGGESSSSSQCTERNLRWPVVEPCARLDVE